MIRRPVHEVQCRHAGCMGMIPCCYVCHMIQLNVAAREVNIRQPGKGPRIGQSDRVCMPHCGWSCVRTERHVKDTSAQMSQAVSPTNKMQLPLCPKDRPCQCNDSPRKEAANAWPQISIHSWQFLSTSSGDSRHRPAPRAPVKAAGRRVQPTRRFTVLDNSTS